jgi:hypothetical protein
MAGPRDNAIGRIRTARRLWWLPAWRVLSIRGGTGKLFFFEKKKQKTFMSG